uniref:50S ribosomal protein L7/L12 n=1 Tax=Lygus hesperus TaxID=30085 RepID=A0A0A9Z1M3_LYGHE
MVFLDVRESDTVIDEIATAYVNMNLATATQFQQLALSCLTHPSSTTANSASVGKEACDYNINYEQTLLQTLSTDGAGVNDVLCVAYSSAICADTLTDAEVRSDGENRNSNASSYTRASTTKTSAASKSSFDVTLQSYPSAAKIKLIK